MEKCFEVLCRTSNQFFSIKSMTDCSKSAYFFKPYLRPELSILVVFIPLYLAMYRATILKFKDSLQNDDFLIAGHEEFVTAVVSY